MTEPKPLTDEELDAMEGHAPAPWRWSGWNFGGDAFWSRDGLEGQLDAADGEPTARATSTEGEYPRVEVRDKATARLIETAPRLLAEVRRLRSAPGVAMMAGLAEANLNQREEIARLRSDEWLEKALDDLDGPDGPAVVLDPKERAEFLAILRKHRDGKA